MSLCLLCFPLQAQTLSITLLNGDCDGDNEVTLTDFGILVAALGSMPGDENWNPDADLDGDGEVTLMDYAILVRNLGQIGADPFAPSLPRQPAPTEGVAYRGLSSWRIGWVMRRPLRWKLCAKTMLAKLFIHCRYKPVNHLSSICRDQDHGGSK